MSGQQRAEKAKRLLSEVNMQLGRAIIVEPFWASATDLMDSTSTPEILAGVAIVRASLFFELVLIVTRLHARDKAAGSLPNLLSCVSDAAVQKYLVDQSAWKRADEISRGLRHQRLLDRLFKQRDTTFAHFDQAKRGFHYGYDDATIILNDSIEMAASLSQSVIGGAGNFAGKWLTGKKLAERFWFSCSRLEKDAQ